MNTNGFTWVRIVVVKKTASTIIDLILLHYARRQGVEEVGGTQKFGGSGALVFLVLP